MNRWQLAHTAGGLGEHGFRGPKSEPAPTFWFSFLGHLVSGLHTWNAYMSRKKEKKKRKKKGKILFFLKSSGFLSGKFFFFPFPFSFYLFCFTFVYLLPKKLHPWLPFVSLWPLEGPTCADQSQARQEMVPVWPRCMASFLRTGVRTSGPRFQTGIGWQRKRKKTLLVGNE